MIRAPATDPQDYGIDQGGWARWRVLLALVVLTIGGATLAALLDRWAPIAVAPGWQFRIYAEGLPHIDNLAVDSHGRLYGSLERGGKRGSVVRVDPDGPTRLIGKLNKPDGLLIVGETLYVAEETGHGRILAYRLATQQTTLLARLDRPEGIELLPDGGLVISEDLGRGRVLRLGPDGHLTTLAADLVRPEGLAVDTAGRIYIAETGSGRVLRLERGRVSVVLTGITEPDQLLLGARGELWITEDAKAGRLLRFYRGRLETVLSDLHSPQGMTWLNDGTLLVAEQGRGRILAVTQHHPSLP